MCTGYARPAMLFRGPDNFATTLPEYSSLIVLGRVEHVELHRPQDKSPSRSPRFLTHAVDHPFLTPLIAVHKVGPLETLPSSPSPQQSRNCAVGNPRMSLHTISIRWQPAASTRKRSKCETSHTPLRTWVPSPSDPVTKGLNRSATAPRGNTVPVPVVQPLRPQGPDGGLSSLPPSPLATL
ncbi:hypothetical protein LZ32DRAFT_361671 [Colletotrichum eremochloae]|nr:hypothetical protein LZ32DRAFT_361671 [Colletotrichum eremochloae]